MAVTNVCEIDFPPSHVLPLATGLSNWTSAIRRSYVAKAEVDRNTRKSENHHFLCFSHKFIFNLYIITLRMYHVAFTIFFE